MSAGNEGTMSNERTPLLASLAAGDGQETQASGVVNKRASSPARQIAPDLLRGLLMALMAIDHTSLTMGAYAHGTGVLGEQASQVIRQWNSDLAYTLRTLSHLCAPGFAMLLGMGVAYFTASRLAQGLQPMQFVKHFLLRAMAIFLVNSVAFGALLFSPLHIVILNAVLPALAFDYLFVGVLSILFAFVVESRLAKAVDHLLGMRNSATDSRGADIAHHLLNAFLLVASAVTLWGSIWTSPNQGDCRVSVSTWPQPSAHCNLDRHLLFDLLFGQVMCPNLHIVSAFPPMAWLPFALFGLLYGRVLLRGQARRSSSVIALNAALSVVFACLFVSTRIFGYGNLTNHCLATPDQARQAAGANQYYASLKSFFYVAKYPPSPAFAFLTLSVCYLLLAIFSTISLERCSVSRWVKSRFNPLLVFGNQPLFFYGVHLPFLQLLSIPVLASPLAKPMPDWASTGKGVGLGWAFLVIYLATLVCMYFACWHYSRFKVRSGRESVWRFL